MKACPQCGATYDDLADVCPSDHSPLSFLDTSTGDLMIGKLLDGRYRLLQKVGEGGMGCIYRAVHTEMGRTCAIKLLTAVSPGKEDALARFKREAKMASRIDSAHAVTIYDFGAAEDGTMFLAMEFIDGIPLSKVLASKQGLAPDRVVRITSQIAEGLTAAHALEIVHRDLKPDNIMITRKGTDSEYVKVLDFGIAKTVAEDGADQLTKTGFVLGTPVYMSPEQLLGERLDPRSDIYSLAIIVYEMLSGRLPFDGENPQAVMMKRILSDPIRLRDVAPAISESIERVVMEGLARNRESRPHTVEAFAAGLKSALMSATQMVGGRVTGRIDDGRTLEWTAFQTQASGESSSGGTEYAHSVVAQSAAQADSESSRQTIADEPGEGALQPAPTIVSGAARRAPIASDSEDRPMRELVAEQPKRGKLVWTVVAVVALLLAGAAIYLLLPFGSSGYTLTVRGVPRGASVFVNDQPKGNAGGDGTIRIPGVDPGHGKLAIKLEGYADYIADIEGKSGEEKPIDALLLPLSIDLNGAMVLVDAGEFEMGSNDDEPDQRPARAISLPAFYIDKYEVTNRQYKEFCTATGHPAPPPPDWGRTYFDNNPDAPVLGIEFDDAKAYATWAKKRLPTEAEWEKAAGWDAKAKKKLRYPWGDSSSGTEGNIGTNKVANVGSYVNDRSPYGAFDMAGNAWEWVDSPYAPYEGSTWRPQDSEKFEGAVRGAVFLKLGLTPSDSARVSFRNHLPRVFPKGKLTAVGLRCAISANDPRIRQVIADRNK